MSSSAGAPSLKEIYEAAGRPGVAKFRDAAKRRGVQLTVKQARDFVQAQSVAQVFAPAPRSEGKVTSPELNARWQADLVDYKTRSPEKNEGHRLILVVIDVFSRFLYAEPLKTKESVEVAQAFERILRRAGVLPKELSTDSGAEFKGAFSEMLRRRGVSQRFKEQINHLAVVDAAIRTLKDTLKKDMTAKSSDSWLDSLPAAVKAYNGNSHAAILNTAPEDVKSTPVLQYELEKQSGLDAAHNAKVHQDRMVRLRSAGAFRLVLPRSTWVRSGQPRYSDKVYELDYFVGPDVVAKDGTRRPVRDALPVPRGSQDVQVPRELKGGRPIRDEGAKAALRPFATALRGFLGPTGSLTLQGAGTKLRGIPGFTEAMAQQRITGIGALVRFLALFPEFVVEGKAPKATVRLA